MASSFVLHATGDLHRRQAVGSGGGAGGSNNNTTTSTTGTSTRHAFCVIAVVLMPYSRGRWVLLAVIIAVFILSMWLLICVRNRRRSRGGLPPTVGTQWMGPVGGYYYNNAPAPQRPLPTGPGAYYAGPAYQQQTQNLPPPAYTADGTAATAYNNTTNAYTATHNTGQGTYYYGQNGNGSHTYTREPENAGQNAYEMQDYPPPNSPPPALVHPPKT
ncbi:uncharacterized protein V1518DRAFT_416927 [Limtongia smithiae]|uniref:uncharacterized protein n=1 Tax=Limtongia smithiae TaxID=1125753 RepID=UPI0034CD0CD7